jgi:hypothetical protein
LKGFGFLLLAFLLVGNALAYERDWERRCKFTAYERDTNATIHTCFYADTKILQAYLNFRKMMIIRHHKNDNYKNWCANLEVGKNIYESIDAKRLSADYVWAGEKALNVKITHIGGKDSFTFKEYNNGTSVRVAFGMK